MPLMTTYYVVLTAQAYREILKSECINIILNSPLN